MNRNKSSRIKRKVASTPSRRVTAVSKQVSSLSTLSTSVAQTSNVKSTRRVRVNGPSTTTIREASSSFTDIILNRSRTPISPIDRVYPNVTLPQSHKTHPLPAPQVAVLSNGIQVITSDSRTPVSRIAVNVNIGSRYEGEDSAGLTHLLQSSVLRSTTNRDVSTLVRDMGKLGADLSAKAGREHLLLTATTPTKVNPVLGALRDVIRFPAYNHDDVMRDIEDYKQRMAIQTPDFLMDDLIHRAAFGNESLGRSIYPTDSMLGGIEAPLLKAWHEHVMTADRLTIAATGVDHKSFVELAEEMFGDMSGSESPFGSPGTQYHGNQIRTTHEGFHGDTHIALALNAPSLSSEQAPTAAVLAAILGDGATYHGEKSSYKQSRMQQNVLKQHDWMKHATTFYNPFSDAGMFGIYGSVKPEAAGDFAHVMLNELKNLAHVSDQEVVRGKSIARMELAKAIESDAYKVEEMAVHVGMFGKYRASEFITTLDKLTTADVQHLATQILDSPVALVALGDSTSIPRGFALDHYTYTQQPSAAEQTQ